MKANTPKLPKEIAAARLQIAAGAAAARAGVNGVALGAHVIARQAVQQFAAPIEAATTYDALRPAADALLAYLKSSAQKQATFGPAGPQPDTQEEPHA